MSKPEIASLWHNNKTGTVYQVWAIALDNRSGEEFVIYQTTEWDRKPLFIVKHTETEAIGVALQTPTLSGWRWSISWHDVPTFFDGVPASETVKAWARPLEMWHEKFTPIRGGSRS